MRKVEKVLAYLVRGTDVLVFEHVGMPEAGIQVPAGTVEYGESAEAALLREVAEETGVLLRDSGKCLGRFPWYREDRNEQHYRNVFRIDAPTGLADTWDHLPRGGGEEQGLVFRCFWMPIERARKDLAADQGAYLL